MTEPTADDLLTLAARTYLHAGSLERHLAETWGMSSTRFWLEVSRLVDAPPPDLALKHGPAINRLRRRRAAGMRQKRAS